MKTRVSSRLGGETTDINSESSTSVVNHKAFNHHKIAGYGPIQSRKCLTGEAEQIARNTSLVYQLKNSDEKRSLGSDSNLENVIKKRTLKDLGSGKILESDAFCWVCHYEGPGMICDLCPRLYHIKCLITAPPSNKWICPECQKIISVETIETKTKVLQLVSMDTLCILLLYVLQRMKLPETKPFHQPVETAAVPTYTDYVVHPMDFTTIDRNIKRQVYGCTEAFIADVKWILHNCIVFNGKNHPLTSVAKSMFKICCHETSELNICPDCYLNSCIKENDDWFCEPCRAPHTLVWAKMKGYPFWPAKVLREENNQVDVRFFGEHDRAWVPLNQVFLLSENPPGTVPKKTKGYDIAKMELSRHLELLSQKFGTFTYAPDRMTYVPCNTSRGECSQVEAMSSLDQCSSKSITHKTSKKLFLKRKLPFRQNHSKIRISVTSSLHSSEEVDENMRELPERRELCKIDNEGVNSPQIDGNEQDATTTSKKIVLKINKLHLMHTPAIVSKAEDPKFHGNDCKEGLARDDGDESIDDICNMGSDSLTVEGNEIEACENNSFEDDAQTINIDDITSNTLQANEDDRKKSLIYNFKTIGIESKDVLNSCVQTGFNSEKNISYLNGIMLSDEESKKLSAIPDLDEGNKIAEKTTPLEDPEDHSQTSTSGNIEVNSSPDLFDGDRLQNKGVNYDNAPLKDNCCKKLLESRDNLRDHLPVDTDLISIALSNKDMEPENKNDGFNYSDALASQLTTSLSSVALIQTCSQAALALNDNYNASNEIVLGDESGKQITDRLHIETECSAATSLCCRVCVSASPSYTSPSIPSTSTNPKASIGVCIEKDDINMEKYINKMASSLQIVFSEFVKDMFDPTQPNVLQLFLNEELAKIKQSYKDELEAFKHSSALQIAEMRLLHQFERDTFDSERLKDISEIKTKLWCANCLNEALYNCCWKSSYCSIQCQKEHWPKHENVCSQLSQEICDAIEPQFTKQVHSLKKHIKNDQNTKIKLQTPLMRSLQPAIQIIEAANLKSSSTIHHINASSVVTSLAAMPSYLLQHALPQQSQQQQRILPQQVQQHQLLIHGTSANLIGSPCDFMTPFRPHIITPLQRMPSTHNFLSQ